jgi:hypothetical protein
MFEVFAVGDSRAREVVLNSLRQPGVDFVPWVTRTRKAYKLWATLKGPERFYRLGCVKKKKCYIKRHEHAIFLEPQGNVDKQKNT